MDIPGHFLGQRGVNQALSLEPGLVLKGRGDDFDSKMGLAARPRPGMARVPMRFVNDFKPQRVKCRRELGSDLSSYAHLGLGSVVSGNPARPTMSLSSAWQRIG